MAGAVGTFGVAALALTLLSVGAPSTFGRSELAADGAHAPGPSSSNLSSERLRPSIGASQARPAASQVADMSEHVRPERSVVVAGVVRQTLPQGTARSTAKVPPGCDRLVSSLVKSTAVAMLGRCVT